MVIHIVFFQPKPEANDAAWLHARDAIMNLPAKIDGIAAVYWGVNSSPEGMGHGFSHGFVMHFIDQAARDAYLPHPDHIAVFPAIDAVSAKTLVFDLEA